MSITLRIIWRGCLVADSMPFAKGGEFAEELRAVIRSKAQWVSMGKEGGVKLIYDRRS